MPATSSQQQLEETPKSRKHLKHRLQLSSAQQIQSSINTPVKHFAGSVEQASQGRASRPRHPHEERVVANRASADKHSFSAVRRGHAQEETLAMGTGPAKADYNRDYYADLGLPGTANPEEISKRFREQVKHELIPAFHAVRVAHEILSDPQQRARYDFQRAKLKLEMGSLTAVPGQTLGSVQHCARSEQKMPHLLDELRKFQLPSHRQTLAIKPGYAGDYRRWVCIMCPTAKYKVTTKESAGMELHLKSHGYSPEHIARVFDVTNGEALYRYFGPYTETEAHKNKEVHSPTQKSRSPTTRRRNPSATDLAPVAPDSCHSQPHNGDSITGQLNDKKQLYSAKSKHHYQSLTELDRISHPSLPHAETPSTNMQPTTAAITPPKMSSETQTTSCAGANEPKGPTIKSNNFLERLGRLTLEEQDSVGGVGGACSSQTEQRDPPNSVDTPSTGKPNQTKWKSPSPGTSSSKLAGEISCNSGSTNTDSSSSGSGRSGSSHAGAPPESRSNAKKRNCVDSSEENNNEDGPDGGDGDKYPDLCADDQPRTFACPYWVRYPQKYYSCSTKILRDIPGLRQHLKRIHKCPEYYCARCYRSFDTDAILKVHLRGPRCTSVGQDPYCDQIDKDKLKSIEKRFLGTSPHDAWESIHQILFPDDEVSDLSPYMDDQRDVQPVTHFVNFFKSYPAIARYLQSGRARNDDSKTPLPEETRSILGKALDIVASPGQENDYITVGPQVCPLLQTRQHQLTHLVTILPTMSIINKHDA
ncbi:hypothetical protein LTR70_007684 [Exophiala xenobiotica]|nr:hypothetical protein LTR70_007684 [Exophiala xenobiotica]